MKIYTKTGDAGETGLFGGARVPKNDARVEAYGDVDELNSVLGVLRSHTADHVELDGLLAKIQARLFDVGAELATAEGRDIADLQKINASDVTALEASIDAQEKDLAPLKTFVLPGG
ncbi:MAG: cob(I)yrinic acid a,c-diamide adenosyltransferase, partial [Myxococcota bacterium]